MSAKRWVGGGAMVYVVLVLSGCGGGGGGGGLMGGGVMDGGGGMSDLTLSDAASRAAQSIPQQGSILQSSNTDVDNITKDVVTADAEYRDNYDYPDGKLRPVFNITYNSDSDGNPEVDPEVELGPDEDLAFPVFTTSGTQICPHCGNPAHIPGGGAGTWRGTLLHKTIGPEDQTDQIPQGDLTVLALTDLQPHFVGDPGDTDYMAGGTWWFVPENPEIPFVFGVFGDTNNPFDEDAGGLNIQTLTGRATYQGDAIGSFVATDERLDNVPWQPTGFFSAVVNLEANFDAGDDGMGTIRGRVHTPTLFNSAGGPLTLKDGTTDAPLPITELTLGEAAITENAGGFFWGETSGTSIIGDDTYSGKWGGEFFGKDETSHPEGVGGTFGASNASQEEDATVTFIGAFGTYQQSSTP